MKMFGNEVDRLFETAGIMAYATISLDQIDNKKIICLYFVSHTDDRALENKNVFYCHSYVSVSLMSDYTKNGWESLYRQARISAREALNIWDSISKK